MVVDPGLQVVYVLKCDMFTPNDGYPALQVVYVLKCDMFTPNDGYVETALAV
jgi:hypothetical protein